MFLGVPSPKNPASGRDIAAARHRMTSLRQEAGSPLAPQPLRDRAAEQAARLQTIIHQHEATSGEEGNAGGPPAA